MTNEINYNIVKEKLNLFKNSIDIIISKQLKQEIIIEFDKILYLQHQSNNRNISSIFNMLLNSIKFSKFDKNKKLKINKLLKIIDLVENDKITNYDQVLEICDELEEKRLKPFNPALDFIADLKPKNNLKL